LQVKVKMNLILAKIKSNYFFVNLIQIGHQ